MRAICYNYKNVYRVTFSLFPILIQFLIKFKSLNAQIIICQNIKKMKYSFLIILIIIYLLPFYFDKNIQILKNKFNEF